MKSPFDILAEKGVPFDSIPQVLAAYPQLPKDPGVCFSIGIIMILVAIAKRGDTRLESRDCLREMMAEHEPLLMHFWDNFRQVEL